MTQTDTQTARQQIIEEAQIRCYQSKAQFRRLRGEIGPERAARAAELQEAVTDYHDAIRPLADSEVIADRWTGADEDGVLWTRQVPATDEHGRIELTGTGAVRMVEESVTLATLPQLIGDVGERQSTRSGFLGTRSESEIVEQRLAPAKLLAAANLLDDLAVDLGFAPDVETARSDADADYSDILDVDS